MDELPEISATECRILVRDNPALHTRQTLHLFRGALLRVLAEGAR